MPEKIDTFLAEVANEASYPRSLIFAECLNSMIKGKVPVEDQSHYPIGPCVYGLWVDDELIYIGRAEYFLRRAREHRNGAGGSPGQGSTHVSFFSGLSPADLDVIERRLILALRPTRNRKHTSIERGIVGNAYLDNLSLLMNIPVETLHALVRKYGIECPAKAATYPVVEILSAIGKEKIFAKMLNIT